MKNHIIMAVCLLLSTFCAPAQTITIFAGNGTSGYSGDGSAATSAKLNLAVLYGGGGIAADASGNVYIADGGNNVIRKVDASGTISTFAGTGMSGYSGDGGQATAAKLYAPFGVSIDVSGNVYIADSYNDVIRKVNSLGVISTVAGNGTGGFSGDGNPATTAELSFPNAIAFDASGNVYIADALNDRIRKVNTLGIISTVDSELNYPLGIAIDDSGNRYIAQFDSYVVSKVNTLGSMTAFAGNDTSGFNGDGSPATSKELNGPAGLAIDATGTMYVADPWNRVVRKVNTSDAISTCAGTDTVMGFSGSGGLATAALLQFPAGVAVDGSGSLYISDILNNVIWRVGSPALNVSAHNEIKNKVLIYPNPVQRSFTVNISSPNEEQAYIIITNVIGEKVTEMNAPTNMPVNVSFDAPAGVYLLSAITADGKMTEKIVK